MRITRELPTTLVSTRIEEMVLETMSCSDILAGRERITQKARQLSGQASSKAW